MVFYSTNWIVFLNSMERHPFIFSNQFKYRFGRHFTFWFCWWAFSSILYSFTPLMKFLPAWERFPVTATEAVFFTSLHMFLSYSFIYFVVPFLLIKEKYILSVIAVILLIFITGVLNALLVENFLEDLRNFVLIDIFHLPITVPTGGYQTSFFHSLLAGLRGGITIAGIAAAIKLTKYWYVKEQTNLQLQKEKAEAQLQLLKAQVHPHFLFNTLNNIYSFTQNTAPQAAKLVTGLSEMLRYMIYEGDHKFVPLHKELKMLQDYIGLEQIRYEKLETHIDIPSDTHHLCIAPLLLLPLVENCFKHGTSHMLENPWINLYIGISGNELSMKLVNGKPEREVSVKKQAGIGVTNVRKRLELLYPDKHQMRITNAEDVFIVDLRIELQRNEEEVAIPKAKKIAHA